MNDRDPISLHDSAPLYEALRRFVEREQAPFYSPGHKGGRSLDPWFRANIAALDLNNLPDTDTLHCPTGPILEAEKLIADAWKVGQSFILVQGSTEGNIAMALAAIRPGDPVIVQRNAHKSVVAGLVQSGARPIWLQPEWDPRFGVGHGLNAHSVDEALSKRSARAVWVLHPTYYGTCADTAALAEIARKHDAILIADGAHSPHFAFHPDLPKPAEQCGAAAVVQSVHKILSGLSQAAVLHIDPAQIDPATVRRALQLLQTTSPHFAIMASIDLARRQMMQTGRALLDDALTLARDARRRLAEIPGLDILGPEHVGPAGSGFHAIDETKILIGLSRLGIDGRDVVTLLNRDHGVQPELAGFDHVLCILTLGNTQRDVDRLVEGFADVARRAPVVRRPHIDAILGYHALSILPEIEMTPREAFFAADRTVPLEHAPGLIAAEVVTPYPPGIPVIMPGERFTREIIEFLSELHRTGSPVSASDPTLQTLKVIR